MSCKVQKTQEKDIPLLNTETMSMLEKHKNVTQYHSSIKAASSLEIIDKSGRKSASATWVMIPNKQVYLAVSFLGFNVAKASFEQSRILAYEKIKRTYIKNDYAAINDILGIDYLGLNTLENILRGVWFIPTEELDNITMSTASANNSYVINFERKISQISKIEKEKNKKYFTKGEATFNSDYLLTSIKLSDDNNKTIAQINYNNWSQPLKEWLPENIQIISLEKNIEINLNYRNISPWTEGLVTVEIPSGYTENNNFSFQ